MFFRRFNFNIFYINYYRLSYFLILLYFILTDLKYNFLTCSYLNTFFFDLNIRLFFLSVLESILILFFLKFFFLNSKKNLINYILIDSYLFIVFMFKNLNKYVYLLNNKYVLSFTSNLFVYI